MAVSRVISRPPRGGFTVVELMVSISVLAVLVALLAGLFGQTSNAWVRGESNTERRRSARALTDYIAAELQCAVAPIEAASVAATSNLQFVVNPSQLSDTFRNADAVFWQAPLATELSFGEIAEIGYFVRWIEPDAIARQKGAVAPRPTLCRFFVNPSTKQRSTTGAQLVAPNPDFLIYAADPKAWLSEALLTKVAPGTRGEDYRGLLADNVLGLWIQCFPAGVRKVSTQEEALARDYDSRVGYDARFTAPGAAPWTERRFLPGSVRVSIAQVDEQRLSRLEPVWERVRALANRSDLRHAAEFLEALREAAEGDAALQPLLPGVRIYATEVKLQNAQ